VDDEEVTDDLAPGWEEAVSEFTGRLHVKPPAGFDLSRAQKGDLYCKGCYKQKSTSQLTRTYERRTDGSYWRVTWCKQCGRMLKEEEVLL
jgi:hypothetical protein